ncbi:tansposase [Chitinispirillum alkaliphilum]|nr:tansposase [Chitinispirillum alkaliphilum]
MSTKPRIIVPEVFYEVTSRGVFGVDIFSNKELKDFFLKELHNSLKMFSFQCYAWAVMDDHYHLLVKSSFHSISKFMQRLNSVYAKHFNRVTNRKGVVFYRRFSSIIVDENIALNQVIHYIHSNPIRSGYCTSFNIGDYEWSGHFNIYKQNTKKDNPSSNEIPNKPNIMLSSEGSDSADNQVISQIRNANQSRGFFSKPESWVVGDSHFVKTVLKKDLICRAQIARHIRENITLERLHQAVIKTVGIENDALFIRGRANTVSTARLLFASLGSILFDYSGESLARYLRVSNSAVSRMISKSKAIPNRKLLFDVINTKLQAERN